MKKTLIGGAILAGLGLVFLVVVLRLTNEGVATEFRQVRQPRPNRFIVTLDVSGTVRPAAVDDLRKALTARLSRFTGQATVSYRILLFGLPGCGPESVMEVLATKAPPTEEQFRRNVAAPLKRAIRRARAWQATIDAPLTTPLHYVVDQLATTYPGERIIVFSDLVNDDRGCPDRYAFPKSAVARFGKNAAGQFIFVHPTPYAPIAASRPKVQEALKAKQNTFIDEMSQLRQAGSVRVFFQAVTDNSEERAEQLESHFQNAIPATTAEVVWERVYKLLVVIVAGVRA